MWSGWTSDPPFLGVSLMKNTDAFFFGELSHSSSSPPFCSIDKTASHSSLNCYFGLLLNIRSDNSPEEIDGIQESYEGDHTNLRSPCIDYCPSVCYQITILDSSANGLLDGVVDASVDLWSHHVLLTQARNYPASHIWYFGDGQIIEGDECAGTKHLLLSSSLSN